MEKAEPNQRKKSGLLVGVTGGIGAGKSLLVTYFRERGYPVFSADEIAREIVAPGAPALEEIRAAFGGEMFQPDGALDRARLRAAIAADPGQRLRLEAITHPRIQARSRQLAEEAFRQGAKIVFYEAPLLFEAQSERQMDKVISVQAPDELRIARTVKRDGGSREQAEKLLRSQMPQEEKARRADFVIENSSGEADLRAAADAVLAALLK